MAQKLLHILGGGLWQVPGIIQAKKLGHRVLVTDVFAERPGYAHADLHEVIDVADLEATLATARKHRIDGIVCDTTDIGVPTAAYVAEKLGLPGMGGKTAANFTDKFLMRELTSKAGVLNPKFRLVRDEKELKAAARDLGYPLMVKPRDNQSSRGVYRVDGESDLVAKFNLARQATRKDSILVEEYIRGTEVTVEGFCVDGNPIPLAVSDKEHFAHRPEVACNLTYPPKFDAELVRSIEETYRAVVRALGLRTGVTHAELMVRGREAFLVEIAARGGGSRIHSHIVPHISGVDVSQQLIEFVMGKGTKVEPLPERRAARLEFLNVPPGLVKSIHGLEEARRIPGVAELTLEFSEGQVLKAVDDDRSRPGYLLALAGTRAEVIDIADAVKKTLRIEIEPRK